ncbi:unnamed protein product [Toxocara canis]|nr:unnamed protein product [Toxocara canis]
MAFPQDRFGSVTLGGLGGGMQFAGYGEGLSLRGIGNGVPFGGLGGAFGQDSVSANAISLLSDKENFQVHGCAFDAMRNRCHDNLNICKGGCKDFGTGVAHDCRCIPYAIIALLG